VDNVAEANKDGMNRFYWILGGVAILGIVLVGYQVMSQALSAAAAEPVEVEGLDDPARLVEMAQGMVLGDPDAPVTIFEFGDYQCPGCGGFALQVKPLIEAAYVQDGKAKFVFYDFPLISIHPNAFLAARAARCASDQGGFWDYHKKLYEQQARWSPSASPVGTFSGYADDLGLDKGDFEDCLNSDKHADVVTAQMKLGEALGVTGTPTVMVSKGDGNATRLPDGSFPFIQEAVDNFLAESGTR
jgi:protein-disulfide isomerase